MMIDDDDGHPKPPRLGKRLEARGATIDLTSSVAPFPASARTASVLGRSLRTSRSGMWNQRIEPAMAQMPGEQRRRGRAIDIVIAEDRDFFAAQGRIGDAFRGRLHLRHGVGIGASICGSSDRESPRPHRFDIAPGQHPPPASPAIDSAAPMASARAAPRASSRSRHSFPWPSATRRETPAALQQACGCGERHDAFR